MEQDFTKTKFSKTDSMVFREIAGETILIPICKRIEDENGIYTLNEVASRVWSLIDGTRDLQEISEVIVCEFEVNLQTAQQDLIELIQKLVSINAVQG